MNSFNPSTQLDSYKKVTSYFQMDTYSLFSNDSFTADSFTTDSITTERPLDGEEDQWKPFSFDSIYVGVSIFGVPGNILTIIVLLSTKELREKPINLFMAHQSVVDGILLLLTICNKTVNFTSISNSGISGQLLCSVFTSNALTSGFLHASGFNLMFLTIERYWAITKPLKYDSSKVLRVCTLFNI